MKKILVVDDEKDLTFFLKANLELGGEYSVIVANNAKDGIRAAEHHRPDLILMDIMMPGMDGLEALKVLKENEKTCQIPVIMLTAKGDEGSKETAASSFNEAYIVKPVEIETLKSKIRTILARRGGERIL